jgi:hypothetical protein
LGREGKSAEKRLDAIIAGRNPATNGIYLRVLYENRADIAHYFSGLKQLLGCAGRVTINSAIGLELV